MQLKSCFKVIVEAKAPGTSILCSPLLLQFLIILVSERARWPTGPGRGFEKARFLLFFKRGDQRFRVSQKERQIWYFIEKMNVGRVDPVNDDLL